MDGADMNAKMYDHETRAKADEATVVIVPLAPQRKMLHDLLETGVILPDVWHALDDRARQDLAEARSQDELLARLLEAQLLTAYQTARVRSFGPAQLVLGNYRILDEIGAGGMGVVYRGEHAFLRRPVAIKVFKDPLESGQVLLQRFFVEMRALARIRHPNVVWALDAGTVKSDDTLEPHRHYLVMEYVAGANLEQLAAKNPLNVAQACELIYQVAGALDETHKLNLIHRDIKPSNILLTPQGNAKLLDFGLALHFGRRRLTMPGTVLGTLGYMAPEQVADAANVDIRADIFGLGATLYFCLTGLCPFPPHGSLTQQAASRLVYQPL
jgi:serine/threonine protein kinase